MASDEQPFPVANDNRYIIDAEIEFWESRSAVREDFDAFMQQRHEWAIKQFPTASWESVCRHIEKELGEIRACNTDLSEWVDVMLLAMEGYCRSGGNAGEIFAALRAKHAINLTRKWKEPNGDEPIEHVREVGE